MKKSTSQKPMINKPKLKAVFIDWNGTLSRSKFWGHLELNPKDKKKFLAIEKSLFGENRHLINPWMRGEKTSEDIIESISKTSELSKEYLIKHFILSCKRMELVSKEIPTLVKKIKAKGIKAIIATDNMDSFSRWTVPELNLTAVFDDVLNSFQIRSLKNDFDSKNRSMFFSDYLRNNKLAPEETMLIDDSEDKEDKIAKFGIKYVRISNEKDLINTLKKVP